MPSSRPQGFLSFPIRARLSLVAALGIGLGAAGIYFYYPALLEQEGVQAAAGKAESLAGLVAHSLAPSLYFAENRLTQEVFRSARQDPQLQAVYVTDPSGRVVASPRGEADPIVPPRDGWNRLSEDGSSYHTSTPVEYRGTQLGTLHLVLSLESLHQEVATTRRRTAIISALLFMLGVAIAYALSASITSPLTRMVGIVQEIARGDLTKRADVSRTDETGRLARSLNTMVDSLVQAGAELEEANQTLEQRVQDRTSALRASEERLSSILENLPDGVALVAPDNRVVLANPAAREHLDVLLKATGQDEVGQLGNLPLRDIAARTAAGRWSDLSAIDGSRRVFEASLLPVHDPRGDEGGGILILRDVTWERETREQVARNQRLAAIGELAAGIAHDFRNILQTVTMSAEYLLLRGELKESLQEEARGILGQGARGATLIRQILDFSRRSVEAQASLDLEVLLQDGVPMLRRLIPENVKIRFDGSGEKLTVRGNAAQLQEAVVNLAVNARDAMPDGGELVVGCHGLELSANDVPPAPELSPGRWAVLWVKDNGSGIPESIRERVFEPFFTSKDPSQGTGLGLAQVFGIVQQHQGQINIETEVGEGTTFWIYLPAQVVAETPPEDPVPPPAPDGSGELILVVEDDPQVAALLSRGLTLKGYRTLIARDGKEALTVFGRERESIALVVSDVVMPMLDGISLLQQMRKLYPALPFVLMSGHPRGKAESALAEFPDVPVLQKPISTDELARQVQQALKT